MGQVNAFRSTDTFGRMLLVDGNAGDGEGVTQDQMDLFDDIQSVPTPKLLVDIGEKFANVDVLLCEKNKDKRSKLAIKFPRARLIGDNKHVHEHVHKKYEYALWLSDPCGPAGHGHESMREVGKIIPKTDFVIVFNAGWIKNRLNGTSHDLWATARQRYLRMLENDWWLDFMGRPKMSKTPVINQSNNFKYEVMVISNFLSDAAKRRPFEVIR